MVSLHSGFLLRMPLMMSTQSDDRNSGMRNFPSRMALLRAATEPPLKGITPVTMK